MTACIARQPALTASCYSTGALIDRSAIGGFDVSDIASDVLNSFPGRSDLRYTFPRIHWFAELGNMPGS